MVYYNWFEEFDPFDTSLANGLTAKDNSEIIWDNAESIGQGLEQSLDNLPITDAKIAVCKKIKTLVNLTKVVHVDSCLAFIDPTKLFERSDSNAKHFDFQLTLYSTALFKDHFMRHLKKSVFAYALKTLQ